MSSTQIRQGEFPHHLDSVPESLPVQLSNRLSQDYPEELRPPSPIVTRRTRRDSISERAAQSPQQYGTIKYFCRQRGHGFVTPRAGGEDVFVHITDIDGEYVPNAGDEVTYKLCPLPPKFEKNQAVHVTIINLTPGVHERWDQPATPHAHPHPSPNVKFPQVHIPPPSPQ